MSWPLQNRIKIIFSFGRWYSYKNLTRLNKVFRQFILLNSNGNYYKFMKVALLRLGFDCNDFDYKIFMNIEEIAWFYRKEKKNVNFIFPCLQESMLFVSLSGKATSAHALTHTHTHTHTHRGGSLHVTVTNVLDCDIVVSEFKLPSRYHIQFWTNAPREKYEAIYPQQPWVLQGWLWH